MPTTFLTPPHKLALFTVQKSDSALFPLSEADPTQQGHFDGTLGGGIHIVVFAF